MNSSNTGASDILVLSMNLLLTFKSALIILGCSSLFDTGRYFCFGCITSGEHNHITGSSAGIDWNITSSTLWSSHNFIGFAHVVWCCKDSDFSDLQHAFIHQCVLSDKRRCVQPNFNHEKLCTFTTSLNFPFTGSSFCNVRSLVSLLRVFHVTTGPE